MNTKIFDVKARMPKADQKITIYATLREEEERMKFREDLSRRMRKIFGITGKMKELGDRIVYQNQSRSLQLYEASDSFWFQDEDLTASEDRKLSKRLPDEKKSRELATAFLKQNELLLPGAYIHSQSFTTVVVDKGKGSEPEEYNTEVHVNLRYTCNDLPVFGPGAKTRVSMVDSKTTSAVYHFWREPRPVQDARELISPELALEVFSKNFRFAKLKEDSAKVSIKSMELGYYAMSPTDMQRFLLPVYKLKGTVSTRDFPRYDYQHYIVAVKYTGDDIRAMGFNIKDAKALVF